MVEPVTMLAEGSVTGQDGDVVHVFVSGNLALDFLGTRKWRRSEPEELLETPADLGDWIDQAGVVSGPVRVDASDLERALALREALYDLVAARLGSPGPGVPSDAIAVLNAAAANPPVVPVVTADGVRVDGDARAVLSTIARSGAEVLAPVTEGVLKECGRDECTRVFLDRSRGARRAWCGMEECGNRVNAAAYRRRRRAADGTAASV